MGTELVPETSEDLHTLTRLSVPENFIEFCRPESFEAYIGTALCVGQIASVNILAYQKRITTFLIPLPCVTHGSQADTK